MKKSLIPVVLAVTVGAAGQAVACSSTEEVMAHFENVKNAYVAKVATMTPEQFPIWTGHLEKFGEAMGRADFDGACAALDMASDELGFGVPAAASGAAPAETTTAAAPADGGKAGSTDGAGQDGGEVASQDSGSDLPPPGGETAGSGELPPPGGDSSGSGELPPPGGDQGTTTAETTTPPVAPVAPQPQPQPTEQPAPTAPTPPASTAAGEPVWVECPRGRCRFRDGY